MTIKMTRFHNLTLGLDSWCENAPAIVHHQKSGLNKQSITVQEQHPCDCLYWWVQQYIKEIKVRQSLYQVKTQETKDKTPALSKVTIKMTTFHTLTLGLESWDANISTESIRLPPAQEANLGLRQPAFSSERSPPDAKAVPFILSGV